MRKIILTVFLTLAALTAFCAAKTEHLRITYEYRSNDRNESQAAAEKHAIEKAKQRALENKFGVDVSSIVVNMDSEKSHDGKFTTDENFFSLGGTAARGEWLTTNKEEILESRHNGDYWFVRVHVDGTAREKKGTPIDLHYAFINNTHDKENRTTYYDKDDIFLRFNSPVSGSLCVYLIDAEKEAYCLLPYMSESKGFQEITANKDYLFFSKDADLNADEFTTTTNQPQEFNVLYIIFTPNKLTKATDEKGGVNWRGETLPRQLKYADFLRWLAKNQTSDEQLQVHTEVISISGK